MSEGTEHTCRFRPRKKAGAWEAVGTVEQRGWRRVQVCGECGRERLVRLLRPPFLIEERAAFPVSEPLSTEKSRYLAARLLALSEGRRQDVVSARGLSGQVGKKGVTVTEMEGILRGFLMAKYVELRWSLAGERKLLRSVVIVNHRALAEHSAPGQLQKAEDTLSAASTSLVSIGHPIAEQVRALLSEKAIAKNPLLVTCLAAVAIHASTGDVLAERVFSARFLGDSKALSKVKTRVEDLLGPIETLGIREGAAVTLLGGTGAVATEHAKIDLSSWSPFIGLSREASDSLRQVRPPDAGMFVVENLAAFEACCRGEVPPAVGKMILWSAGYPGRAIKRIIELAGAFRHPVWVWCDIDVDGVRIARLLKEVAGGRAIAFAMSPAALRIDSNTRPMTGRAINACRKTLEADPGGFLSDTLGALLDARSWREQESLLGDASLWERIS